MFTNAFYAGGFGNVRERVNADIADGSFKTDVFAGALCNYRATGTASSVAGDVAITISGGTIGGNIYGRGQGEYSTVAGNVTVAFTGDGSYTCGVYGYGVQSAATESSDSWLDLVEFTGTLAGNIGGFDSIRFGAASAAAFGAAAPETGWSIASGLADADAKYTVNWSFATYELGLGDKIFGGEYDGYGFTFDGGDGGVLKFSKFA